MIFFGPDPLDPLAGFTLRAEATFSLGELRVTTVQFSIVHARNSSRDSQGKLIVRSVVKWSEFRGN